MSALSLLMEEVEVCRPGLDAPCLSGVTLAVSPGERVALVGLNGTGKTTLLMAAAGLLPHRGRIEVAGLRLERRSLGAIRDRLGFLFGVPEDQLLFPRVLDDVGFALRRRGMARPEVTRIARATLDALGVGALADRGVHQLSHGQKQRVALAGALVAKPELLLLDEPSAALDPPARRALAALLSAQAAAMLVATHDIDFAQRCCNRFLLLDGGSIAADVRDPKAVESLWEKACSRTRLDEVG